MKKIKNCPIEDCGEEMERVSEVSFDCKKCGARLYITVECHLKEEVHPNG